MTTATAKKAKPVTLGQSVTYVNHKGLRKAALVTGTPDSVVADGGAFVPPEGHVHLRVFGIDKTYTRLSVPSEAVVAQAKEQGNTDFEDGGFFTV